MNLTLNKRINPFTAFIVLFWTWVLISFAFCGCSTVIPDQADPEGASMDGNDANSGDIGRLPDGNYIVTPHWRDRYNHMMLTFSNKFQPPLSFDAGVKPYTNGTFLIDSQHKANFTKMNVWRKNPAP